MMGGAFSGEGGCEVRCEACGRVISSLPFKCRYCGGVFCAHHHLPENHSCPALPLIRQPRVEGMFTLPYPTRKIFAAEKEEEPVGRRLEGERWVREGERRVRIPVTGAPTPSARAWRLPKIPWSTVLAALAAAILIILFSTAFQKGTLPQPAAQAPLLSGEPLTVGEILRNPSIYMGRVVRVEGAVALALIPSCVDAESRMEVNYALVDGMGHTIPLAPTERTFLSAYIGSIVEVEGVVRRASCREGERPLIVAFKVYSRTP